MATTDDIDDDSRPIGKFWVEWMVFVAACEAFDRAAAKCACPKISTTLQ